MSNAIFPTFAGLAWSIFKAPQWSTRIQKAASGRELRAPLFITPIYKFTLSYEVLRARAANQELQNLMGFFNNRQGAFDSFLFDDVTDNIVTLQGFGAGDGTTKSFQLVRAYGYNAEPVMNLNGAPLIYANGTLKTADTDYTIVNGMVTFIDAPASGASLNWTGKYYYRCRFSEDSSDFENFMHQLWSLKKLELIGSLSNKI